MKNNQLNVVDEKGNITGQASRDDIHKQGLLHREIHVLFYTPKQEVIFQHRSKNVDTFPNLLCATVGGHVEMGETIEETSIKETKEETGLKISKNDLEFIKLLKHKSYDKNLNRTNYALKYEYAYCYRDDIKDLKIEKDKSLGFESWPIKKILNLSEKDKNKFMPFVSDKKFLSIFKTIFKKSLNITNHGK